MPKVKLTTQMVKKAQCPQGRHKENYFDTQVTGLMLEVRASGGKTWYLRYKDERGKTRQHRLGYAQDLTPSQAREKARKLRTQIALGEDPAEQKRLKKQVITFETFIHEHYLPHVKSYKRSWKTDLSLIKNHLLPYWGKLHLDEISKRLVQERIRAHRKTHKPGSTNRIIILVRYMFNLMLRWELEGVQNNPTEGIPLYPENNQIERYLSQEEAKKLFEAVEASPNRHLKYIVAMLLLTGARKREVLDAQWGEFDFERRIWTIPKTKSGRPRHVPLSDGMLQLLMELGPKEKTAYLFPNPDTGKPYVTIFYSWDTARKKAGLADVRIHDLRHSFASFLVNAGRSLYEVQKILGHTQIKTTQRYAHLDTNTLIQAANQATSAIPLTRVLPQEAGQVAVVSVGQ